MRIWNLFVAICIFAASCGGSAAAPDNRSELQTPSNSSETSVSTAETAETAEPFLPDELTSNPLVAFEASWLCQVQRHSFPDLDEMQELRLRLLEEAGLSQEAYDEFRTALDAESTLRAEVLEVFEGSCQ